MKFCEKCGTQNDDDAVVCAVCGNSFQNGNDNVVKEESTLTKVAKAFMIVGTVLMSLYTFGIALAWCLPMTLSYCKKIKNGTPIGTGFKVCSLLFVSLIAGVLMLCETNN
ncbi:MAG: zinc-ribbon domain-containing protein [Ruminococcaceae bacterium]|nr:zinc-ribbon domain-containing protein [Oscillospiraceae bacterium]